MVDSMYHSRFSEPLKRECKVSWMFADMVFWTVLVVFSVYFLDSILTNEDFRAGNNCPPTLSQGMLKKFSYQVLTSRHCRILSLKQDKCTVSMLTLVGCALIH